MSKKNCNIHYRLAGQNYEKLAFVLIAMLFAFINLRIFAQEPDAQTNPGEQGEEQEEAANYRDPFWPPGYTPPVETDESENEVEQPIQPNEIFVDTAIKWPTPKIKGITAIGDKYSAIIQDVGVVEEGKTITIKRGNVIFSWQVLKINKKGVELKQLEARPAR